MKTQSFGVSDQFHGPVRCRRFWWSREDWSPSAKIAQNQWICGNSVEINIAVFAKSMLAVQNLEADEAGLSKLFSVDKLLFADFLLPAPPSSSMSLSWQQAVSLSSISTCSTTPQGDSYVTPNHTIAL